MRVTLCKFPRVISILRLIRIMKLVNVSAARNPDSDIFISFIISLAAMLLALLEQMDIDSRVRFYDEFSEIAKCLESDPVPYWGSIEGDDL